MAGGLPGALLQDVAAGRCYGASMRVVAVECYCGTLLTSVMRLPSCVFSRLLRRSMKRFTVSDRHHLRFQSFFFDELYAWFFFKPHVSLCLAIQGRGFFPVGQAESYFLAEF